MRTGGPPTIGSAVGRQAGIKEAGGWRVVIGWREATLGLGRARLLCRRMGSSARGPRTTGGRHSRIICPVRLCRGGAALGGGTLASLPPDYAGAGACQRDGGRPLGPLSGVPAGSGQR